MDIFTVAGRELERVVAAVAADQWAVPTPSNLSAHDLVCHVVAGNVFAVRLLAGASAADATRDLDAVERRAGIDLMPCVKESSARQQIAFATADPDRPLDHPGGQVDLETFARFRLGDLVVHTWDLATATGQDATLDVDLVEDLWRRVEPHRDAMRASGAYGEGADPDLDPAADLQTRLLDTFGRRPRG